MVQIIPAWFVSLCIAATETCCSSKATTDVARKVNADANVVAKSYREVKEKFLTTPVDVAMPAWAISGDDVASCCAPGGCRPTACYLGENCLCQDRARDLGTDEDWGAAGDDGGSILERGGGGGRCEDSTKDRRTPSASSSSGRDAAPCTTIVGPPILVRLPLEAPNPKKPGETHFIEDDMLELLETL